MPYYKCFVLKKAHKREFIKKMANKNNKVTIGFKVTPEKKSEIQKFCKDFNINKQDVFSKGMLATNTDKNTLAYIRTKRKEHENKALIFLHSAIHEMQMIELFNKQIKEKEKDFNINEGIINICDNEGNPIEFKPQFINNYFIREWVKDL